MKVSDAKSLVGDFNIHMRDLVTSKYFDKLLNFLRLLYESKKNVYPKITNNVFKGFRVCDPKSTRVVFIGDRPYLNNFANGVAYAAPFALSVPRSLEQMVRTIEETMDKLYLDFDPSLEKWLRQGVMLINSSLVATDEKAYYEAFKPLIAETIKTLTKLNNGIIFVLVGAQAQKFDEFIDKSVAYTIKCNEPLEFGLFEDIFSDINNIIESNNGKEYTIDW